VAAATLVWDEPALLGEGPLWDDREQRLYGSTSTALSQQALEDEPHAGSLFAFEPGVRGRPPFRFAG
jgi:sugar lactone lactonase YvrE